MALSSYKETADIYSVLKPIILVSKVIGLAPYSVIGDIGKRKVSVSTQDVVYSVGVFIIFTSIFGYCQHIILTSWDNICTSSANIQSLGTLFHLIIAYCTFLLNSKKIARQLSRLNDLIGDIYYSDWKKDIQTMLAMLILTVTMILISAVVEVMSYTSYDPSLFMPYYIAEFVCIMSECQFAAVMIILKRIIQNWNVQIGAISEVDDVINLPNSLKQINKRASKTFTVSNNLKISDRSNIQSNVMRFQYLRELHVSAREVAESVNSAYSLLLLLSTAIMFLSLTHILYFIFMDFVVQKNSLLCNETPNISYFIWLFYYVLRLIWLVYFPCFAAKEVCQHT